MRDVTPYGLGYSSLGLGGSVLPVSSGYADPRTLRHLGTDCADSTPYRDIGDCLPVRTASHPRRLESLPTPL